MLHQVIETLNARVALRPALRQFHRRQVGGAGRRRSTSTISARSPASRSARSPARSADDIELALDAAHAAKDAWGKTAPAERADDPEQDRRPHGGESRRCSPRSRPSTTASRSARRRLADLPLAIDHFRYFAGCIRAQEGSLSEIDHDTVAYHFHEPLGVVGQIIPWNFPLLMAAWKLAPALAAGNCVVLKPAEQTPMAIMVLMDLDRRPAAAGRAQRRQRLRRRGRQAARPEQAHRQDRVHRRDHDRPADHAVRRREPDPGHAGAGRQVAEHLLRRRDGRGRRLLRQGARRLRHVRAQPGRGLHLPVAARWCRDRSTTTSWRRRSRA